jgi:hypothetical protein
MSGYESSRNIENIKTIVDYIKPYLGKKHLDFGCGSGWLSLFLHYSGLDVSGYDISKHPSFPRYIPFISEFESIRKKSFDSVSLSFVSHESGFNIIDDTLSVISDNGKICIIDYELTHASKDEFFYLFNAETEITELLETGFDECYSIHTKTGLSDCINELRKRNLEIVLEKKLFDKYYICVGSK